MSEIQAPKINLNQIVSAIGTKKAEFESSKPQSMKAKVASWYGDLESLDIEKVVALQETMQNFLDDYFGKVRFNEKREMTKTELHDLMAEYLKAKEVEAAMKAVKDQAKSMYFLHLNAKHEARGLSEEDAAQVAEREPVADLGHSFDRYGTGTNPATLNVEALKEALGDKADKYFKTKVVETVELDEDTLLADYADPEVQKALQAAIIPGTVKNPSFTVRAFSKAERKEAGLDN